MSRRAASGWTASCGGVVIFVGLGLLVLAGWVADHAGDPAPLLWGALISVVVGIVAVCVGACLGAETWIRYDDLLAAKPRPVLGLPDADGVWTHQQVLDWLPVSADVRATLDRGEGR